ADHLSVNWRLIERLDITRSHQHAFLLASVRYGQFCPDRFDEEVARDAGRRGAIVDYVRIIDVVIGRADLRHFDARYPAQIQFERTDVRLSSGDKVRTFGELAAPNRGLDLAKPKIEPNHIDEIGRAFRFNHGLCVVADHL